MIQIIIAAISIHRFITIKDCIGKIFECVFIKRFKFIESMGYHNIFHFQHLSSDRCCFCFLEMDKNSYLILSRQSSKAQIMVVGKDLNMLKTLNYFNQHKHYVGKEGALYEKY